MFKEGDEVACTFRRPSDNQPWVTGSPTPWKGIILDQRDPRAWAGKLAFGQAVPTQEQVDAHFENCAEMAEYARQNGLPGGGKWWPMKSVPVAYEFGQIYFEDPECLVPYSDELKLWQEKGYGGFHKFEEKCHLRLVG